MAAVKPHSLLAFFLILCVHQPFIMHYFNTKCKLLISNSIPKQMVTCKYVNKMSAEWQHILCALAIHYKLLLYKKRIHDLKTGGNIKSDGQTDRVPYYSPSPVTIGD